MVGTEDEVEKKRKNEFCKRFLYWKVKYSIRHSKTKTH